MKANILERGFERMGARLKVQVLERTRAYALDIRRDGAGEFFDLRVQSGQFDGVETQVLQVDPGDRHLLLGIRSRNEQGMSRFLCGHDERHWFAAAVPRRVSTIRDAKEALKPAVALAMQDYLKVRQNRRNRRRNEAFVRQGEWFFMPVTGLIVKPELIHRDEPIQRGAGSKPHIVEELYRVGGEVVMIARGVGSMSVRAYQKLIKRKPHLENARWERRMTRMDVFARGKIRHPDHATIRLADWHRVEMNRENEAPVNARENLLFIDSPRWSKLT